MTMPTPSKSPSDPAFAAVVPGEPADVREARIISAARITIATQLIGSLTDWVGMGCLTFLIAIKTIGPEFAWAIPALASGSTVAKMRNKLTGSGSAAALLIAGSSPAWKAAAVLASRQMLVVALALTAVGCGATIPPTLVQDARQRLAEAAAPLPDATAKMNATGAALAKLCPVPPALTVLPLDTCRTLIDGFNASAEVIGVVQPALRFADAVLATVEDVQ